MTLERRAFGTDLFVGLKLQKTKNCLLEPMVGFLFFGKGDSSVTGSVDYDESPWFSGTAQTSTVQ